MSRLWSVLGSAAFRVVLVSVAAFVLAAGVIVAILFWQMNEILTERTVAALTAEIGTLRLDARAGGLPALIEAVEQRSRTPGPALYHLADGSGRRLAGNLENAPAGIAPGERSGVFRYGGNGEGRHAVGIALDLGSNGRLFVGRDIEDQRWLAAEARRVFLFGFGGLAVAGLLAGLVISRFVLGRIDAINATSRSIMAGDLSRRIPLQGTGDELDALAANLNAMLDRIEQLMNGLREISDNIAHDLKTPLTRLRSGVEAALRDAHGEAHREALERTIEEADGLIRTFNALLLIARLEAGALEESTERFDVGALAHDVAELYEPVADLAGLKLVVKADEGQFMRGNRQLVSQAIANLIDNATKYSAGYPSNAPDPTIRLVVQSANGSYEISVADRGPGIAEADRERVLKRFVRLETSRTAPGTGLGLSLVAAVARLHGGAVRLEDNAPGLRVVLVLPKGLPAS